MIKNRKYAKGGLNKMKQRVAIITGADGGMGRAAAERLLKDGYDVILAGLSAGALEQSRQMLEQLTPGRVEHIVLDVSDETQVQSLAQSVKSAGKCLCALVNCAGVFRGGLLHEAKAADFDLQFAVNVKGMFFMMKHCIPLMLESGQPCGIVNIASVSGVNGDYNAPLYCASKSAVIGLTKAAALDYAAQGIRINCISPSATETPMFLNGSTPEVIAAFKAALPDHKLGLPVQIANTVSFLLSEDAAHIVGNNLCVDGGLSAWNGQPRQDKTKK